MKFVWGFLTLLLSSTAIAQDCSVLSSHATGWYSTPFQVQLQLSAGCASGAQIVYELGGETPGPQSAAFTTPIQLDDPSGQPDRFTGIRTTITPEISFLDRFS
jgi:hypothetical protein